MALPEVDAVVIGLGAAGGIMAKELSVAGMKVVGLELGPFRRTADFQYHDELRFEVRQELLQPKISETPMQLRIDANSPAGAFLPWTISVGVGGGSVHYGTWNWRMLPHHFRILSDITKRYGASAIPAGSNIVDWPISYDDLAPMYDKVETELGISGKAGNINGTIQPGGNPFEGPRSKDFPLPPLLQATSSRMFATAAAAMGYKVFPTPSGIISQDYNGRPGCNYCGFCSSYGCHVGAKSSTLVTVIPVGLATGNLEIRTGCRVVKINNDGSRATSVNYIDQAGVQQEQPASLIILSNYTWEVVRVLLMSGLNKNGMVGKYFMAHQYNITTGFFDNTITNVSPGAGGSVNTIDEFNGDNFDHTGLGFIEGASITSLGGGTHGIGGAGNVPPGTPAWGSGYKTALKKYYGRNTGLIAQLPNLPYEANFLDLDPNVKDAMGLPVIRITYNGYDNEVKAATYLQNKQEAILKQMGANVTVRGSYLVPPATNHEVGGARMGDDPTKAVVNRYGQSHELPNLFVDSGAIFPTYFGYNPTNTIEALSFWEANYIKTETKTGGSLSKYI
jgi:gluconate 2-dehydrogenase alpha chain